MIRLWRQLGLAVLLGLGLASFILTGAALADPGPTLFEVEATPASPPPDTSASPGLVYAKVATTGVPVYADPMEAMLGLSPSRTLDPGYVWVTLANTQTLQYGDKSWYTINEGEYVQADHLQFFQPSAFKGLPVSTDRTFAFVVFDTWTAAAPATVPASNSVKLSRYSTVIIRETKAITERFWYRVGPDQWVEQGMLGLIQPKPRPEGVGPQEKWIEVDLYEQTLAAYEGDQLVYATLVSSGLPFWQTEQGLFRIWIKIKQRKMSGRDGFPDYYFLEDVPWTMYFNGSYALHGAYWHDRFGIKHSHGCVNLSLADAKWLFDWATPTEDDQGTWVWVHDRL
jgi:lipoprotein-anchoring transpeptidase ErfK/SrfK